MAAMLSRTFLPAAGIALLMASLPGCRKPTPGGPGNPSTPPPAPEAKAAAILSAEPTSFQAVNRQLDSGGWLYLYLSTEAFLAKARETMAALRPALLHRAEMDEPAKAQAERSWDLAARLFARSGITEISGFGLSSIAMEPGYYQTKAVLHHYEGKGTGFLWKLNGENNGNAFDLLPILPANTALAFRSHFTLAPVLEALHRETEADAELKKAVEEAFARFRQNGGISVEQLINGIGPAWTVILTLDESRPFNVPVPKAGGPITIPEPGLLIEVEIRDPALLARVESALAPLSFATAADADGYKIRKLSLPVLGPFAQSIIVWNENRLTLASSEALWRETLAVTKGGKPGLAALPAVEAALKNHPDSATCLSIIAPSFFAALSRVRQAGFTQSLPKDDPMAQFFADQFAAQADFQRFAVDWTLKTPEGWVYTTRGEVGPAKTIPAAIVFPSAILAGTALPLIQKTGHSRRAGRKAGDDPVNDLRMLEAAIDQWGIEGKQATGAQPTTNDIVPFLKPGTRLHRQLTAAPAATRFILREGLPPVTIPKLGDRPVLSKEWEARYPEEALKPYLPARE